MRYLKVLVLGCLLFLALVFFFQNQSVLSTKMELKLDLFFVPPMTSMTLPLYFLVVCAFFTGILLALCLLVWDRMNLAARIMKDKWQIQSLSSKLSKAERQLQNRGAVSWYTRLCNFFSPQAEVAKVTTIKKSVPQTAALEESDTDAAAPMISESAESKQPA